MTQFDESSIALQVSAIRLNAELVRAIMREAWTAGGIDFPAHDAVVDALRLIDHECDVIDSKLKSVPEA